MPLPWAVNQWACNQFAAEPERDAILDAEKFSLVGWLPEPSPVSNPDHYTVADWYGVAVADWPEIEPVIAVDQQVRKLHDNCVRAFLDRVYGAAKDELECFDRANYQLYVAGYSTAGRPADDDRTILLIKDYWVEGRLQPELEVVDTLKAIDVLRASLRDRTPVLLGLQIKFVGEALRDWRPNERRSTPYVEPTNHYVVAVGMGLDGNRPYISYYDYGHPTPRQRIAST